MHPARSIIAFTTASGAGYGLLFLLAVGVLLGLIPPDPRLGAVGLGLALALTTAGLLASLLHLGHPERAWRALTQARSSWLSREGLFALVTYVPVLVLAAGWILMQDAGPTTRIAAALSALGAVATVWCTGMIYASLKPIREWHDPLVPWLYLAFGLMSGALLGHVLLLAFAAPRPWIGVSALLATLVAFGLKALYWRRMGEPVAGRTPEAAIGLAALGRARMTDPPHTQTNYLLSEMGYRIGRKHARTLRWLALLLGLGGGGVLTLAALLTSGWLAVGAAGLAAAAGLVGVVIERWLFFAEATHTVTLYYGRRPAA